MRQIARSAFAAIVALSLSGPVLAGDHGLAGGPPPRASLPVDPQILPPDTRPGECVNRRVTGPGGAYRWDRTECDDGERGWSDFDRWSYGRPPLRVEDGRPDRYGRHGDYAPPPAYDPPPIYDPPPPPPPRAYAEVDYGAAGHAGSIYERREEGYAYSRERAYDSGYVGERYGDAAPPYDGPGYAYAYQSAGRDAYGFLVWPGKQP